MIPDQMIAGRAAEHLVIADILLAGYPAFLVDAGLPYDLAADVGGRIVRVQVKATDSPCSAPSQVFRRDGRYMFNLRRRRGAACTLAESADVFAFVGLDVRRVAYLSADELDQGEGKVAQCVAIRTEGRGRTFDSLASFLEAAA